jgi:hypothetical protein
VQRLRHDAPCRRVIRRVLRFFDLSGTGTNGASSVHAHINKQNVLTRQAQYAILNKSDRRLADHQGRRNPMANHPNRNGKDSKREFLAMLATLTPAQMANQYQVVGEAMCEEEDHGRIAAAKSTLAMIEAVGKFLHGIAFDDAMEYAAGHDPNWADGLPEIDPGRERFGS